MRKPLPITLFFLLSILIYAQNNKAEEPFRAESDKIERKPLDETYLQNGKAVFKINEPTEDKFREAIENLQNAIEINPNNAEAHYFLGYAYSRLNSFDGRTIDKMNLDLVLKASEQFETVNKLTPKYSGEKVILDPYSKLTGEWGSLSIRYFATNKIDSAVWACKEGRRRGGFSNYYLGMARLILDNCTKGAFLVSSGDNITLPIWYLQKVEKYRKDVKHIDIALLNAEWYPKILEEKESIDFGYAPSERDTLDYCYVMNPEFTINKKDGTSLSWEFNHYYLYRGDRLFLNLLKKNRFKKNVYFTYAFDSQSQLNLKDHLQDLIILERINYDNKAPLSSNDYLERLEPVIENFKNINLNSYEEVADVDRVRFFICSRIIYCIDNNKIDEANNLMNLLETDQILAKIPYQLEELIPYKEELKQILSSI